MDRSVLMLVIGLAFGGGIGFTIAAANGVTLDGHDHAEHAAGHSGMAADHAHGATLSLPAGDTAPSLSVEVLPDPVSGWNLHVSTTHFRFAPEHAGHENVDGEGHAHVYVNGAKIGRLYGPWMYLGSLPGGEARITVSLNANDHSPLAVDGVPLEATATVSQ